MGRNESQRSTHRLYNFPEGMKISNTLSRPVKSRSSSDVEGCDEVRLQALVTEDGLEHIEEDVDEYGIAGKIWEAAFDLKTYIRPPANLEMDPPCSFTSRRLKKEASSSMSSDSVTGLHKRPQTIIELGAGTGAAGLFAAANMDAQSGDLAILTDLDEVIPLLKKNRGMAMGLSGAGAEVWVRALPWGDEAAWRLLYTELSAPLGLEGGRREVTHILCSDVVYFPALLAPLLRTLIWITEDFRDVEVIISCRIREMAKEAPFWHAFGAWFKFEPVILRSTDPRAEDKAWRRFGVQGETWVFAGRRRNETYGRIVTVATMGDVELLTAWHDDSFEMLLLMEMDG